MSTVQMSLKCDEPNCNVEIDCPDYGPQYIDTPCPECGANLLTKEDFDDAEPMRLMFAILEKAGLTKDSAAKDAVEVRFNQHNGKTALEFNAQKGGDT